MNLRPHGRRSPQPLVFGGKACSQIRSRSDRQPAAAPGRRAASSRPAGPLVQAHPLGCGLTLSGQALTSRLILNLELRPQLVANSHPPPAASVLLKRCVANVRSPPLGKARASSALPSAYRKGRGFRSVRKRPASGRMPRPPVPFSQKVRRSRIGSGPYPISALHRSFSEQMRQANKKKPTFATYSA